MDIHYDAARGRFTYTSDGETAYVTCEPVAGRAAPDDESGAAIVAYSHVFVPPAQRGRGVAGAMVKHALEHARDAGWKVVPSCPYIANQFLPRHPEFKDVIAD